MTAVKAALMVLTGLAAAGYPFLVYYGLTHWDTRTLALTLGIAMAALAVPRLAHKRARVLAGAAPTAAAVAMLLALAWTLDDPRLVLALPVLINATLLLGFAVSLLGETSIVERFARSYVDDLSVAEVHYCRAVTLGWVAVFAINGLTAALLAWYGPLRLWTLHTGLVSYLLIGVFAAAEYVLRKYRFRRYGSGIHDRILAQVFPPFGPDR